MKKLFPGPVLLSHASTLHTGARVHADLDCEFADEQGIHFQMAGCIDAPDVMPAGSTIARWAHCAPLDRQIRLSCTTKPSEMNRA